MFKLAQPGKIKNLELKNRYVMEPIHLLYTPDGYVTDRFRDFYYRRAEGGAGLVIVGGCSFDEYCVGKKSMLSLNDDSFIPGLKEFTDGMHERGAKVGVQLYHAGRYVKTMYLPEGWKARSASSLYCTFSKETSEAMTIEEIKQTVIDWAKGAARAKKAGFDLVEILGSAGYLICQFLSPVTNIRTDEYGGSWENRCRFPLEVIRAVREAVGPDYPVGIRLAGNDFVENSNTNVEWVEFAKLAEAAGIDVFNVTGGWHETAVPQVTGELPRGGYAYLSRGVKEAVSVPVIAGNRHIDPYESEKILAMGMADFIGCCRPLISDPDMPNKYFSGRLEIINQCIGCNQGCLARTFFGKPVQCTVNGFVGREHKIQMTKAEKSKNVLVIGGGPGGMRAAILLAQRGHRVTLWEKDGKLGGQLYLAMAPYGKEEFGCIIDNCKAQLDYYGVNVVLNQEATKEKVVAEAFDTLIVATGAKAKTLTLPGDEGKIEILSFDDVLLKKAVPGKDVVIIGGGAVGCELAVQLAFEGVISAKQLEFLTIHKAETPEKINDLLNDCARNISIVEMQKRIGANFDLGGSWPVFKQMKRLGVKQYTSATVQKVTDKEVVINKEGEIISIPADTIILAVGCQSVNELSESLKGSAGELYTVGDAHEVGKILELNDDITDLCLTI